MKKNVFRKLLYLGLAICLAFVASPAQAKVSAQEAERLKKDLTPFGATRAGNAEGTIPAWEGGMIGIPKGVTYDIDSGDIRPDPFANEKPLYIVTAQNLDQYRHLITPGTQMLFSKYPDTFQMHVYPTHRTMAAPQWVYDEVYKNATRVELSGFSMKNAFAGPGFPIPNWGTPEVGIQLLFNHMSMWKGSDKAETYSGYDVYENTKVQGNTAKICWQFPYMWDDSNMEGYEKSGLYYGALFSETLAPAASKGSLSVVHRTLNYETGEDGAWSYSPGTRRVRRAPGISHDTPGGAGLYTMDDIYTWNGDPARFDWNYIETKEMLVPYNCYAFDLASVDDLLTPHHPNPKYLRWELHRVHIYESVLKQGSRHVYGKRVWFQDEDSWCNLIQDKYDTRGALWRVQFQQTLIAYPVPFMYTRDTIYFDNQVPYYSAIWMVNGIKKPFEYKRYPTEWFTPEHLRRVGRR